MPEIACPVCLTTFNDRDRCPVCGEPVGQTITETIHSPIDELYPAAPETRAANRPRRWYTEKYFLIPTAIATILLIALVINLVRDEPASTVGQTDAQPTGSGAVPTVAATTGPTLTPTNASTVEPTSLPTQLPGQTWTQVHTLSGTGPKRGPTFELTGRQARLLYTLQGDEDSNLVVYVVAEGDPLGKEGPVVREQGPKEGEAPLVRSPGRYYVGVNSGNGSWVVTVEELR